LKEYNNLLITVEHAATGKMGGIGSYNDEIDRMSDNLLVLLVDDKVTESPAENIILCRPYIENNLPELLEWYDKNYHLEGYVIFRVVQLLMKENPGIRNIDTHEYLGVAARVAEACRAGLLGREVRVRTHGHGGQIQLERATGGWIGIDSYGVNVMERSCMENADELWFSSNYLKDLYTTAGVRTAIPSVHVLGLPYDLRDVETKPSAYVPVKNLVFVGRMNRLKGYEVFTELVEYLTEQAGLGGQIERVVAIGIDDGSMRDQTRQLEVLAQKHQFVFERMLLTRNEVLSFEAAHAHDSLFVLPYMSDNYSVAMLELIEAKAPIICLDTGGNIELVDTRRWRDRLALDSQGLCLVAERYMRMSEEERMSDCELLYQDFIKQQIARNEANKLRFTSFTTTKLKKSMPVVSMSLAEESTARKGLHFDSRSLQFHYNGKGISLEEAQRYAKGSYVFMVTDSAELGDESLDMAIEACTKAVPRTTSNTVLSIGLEANMHDVHLPMYIDLNLLGLDPMMTILRNVCVSSDTFFEFIALYSQARGGRWRRGPSYLLAGLTYFLLSREMQILPIPVLVPVKTTKISDLTFDEALFADLAQFGDLSWAKYRHIASLRYEIWHGAEVRRYPGPKYVKDYVDVLLKTGQRESLAGKAMRGAIKAQLKLLRGAVSVRKRLR
jgi:glycosyltransferase involved in cell wall biosynthesis